MTDYLIDNYSQELADISEHCTESKKNKKTKMRKSKLKKRDLKCKAKESDSDSSFELNIEENKSELESEVEQRLSQILSEIDEWSQHSNSKNETNNKKTKLVVNKINSEDNSNIAKFEIIEEFIRNDKILNDWYQNIWEKWESNFAEFFPRLEYLIKRWYKIFVPNTQSQLAPKKSSIIQSITKKSHPKPSIPLSSNKENSIPEIIELSDTPSLPPITSILRPAATKIPKLSSITSYIASSLSSLPSYSNPSVSIVIEKSALCQKRTRRKQKVQETEEIVSTSPTQMITLKSQYKTPKQFDIDSKIIVPEDQVQNKPKKPRKPRKKKAPKAQIEPVSKPDQKRLDKWFEEIKETQRPLGPQVKREEQEVASSPNPPVKLEEEVVEVKVKPEDDLMLNNEFGITVLNYRAKKLTPEVSKVPGFFDSIVHYAYKDVELMFNEQQQADTDQETEMKGELKEQQIDQVILPYGSSDDEDEAEGLETTAFDQCDIFNKQIENDDATEQDIQNTIQELDNLEEFSQSLVINDSNFKEFNNKSMEVDNICNESSEIVNKEINHKNLNLDPKLFFKQRDIQTGQDISNFNLSWENSDNHILVQDQIFEDTKANSSIQDDKNNIKENINSQNSVSSKSKDQRQVPRFELMSIELLKQEMSIFGIKAVPSKNKMVGHLKQIWKYFHLEEYPKYMLW